MSSKAVGNSLRKNHSAWAIFSILNNTKLNEKPAIAWRIVSGKKITAEVFLRVIRKSRGEILLRGLSPESHKVLGKLMSGAEHINLYLPEDMVLFQTETKGFEIEGDATVKIPTMIAQIDRRKHMRLFVNDQAPAKVKFFKQTHSQRANTQLFEKQCFDVSAGGLSFIVSRMESKFFQIGDRMAMLRLLVENKEICVEGKVVNILEVEPDGQNGLHYRGRKICIRYEKLNTEDQKFLADFVFRHADLSEAV